VVQTPGGKRKNPRAEKTVSNEERDGSTNNTKTKGTSLSQGGERKRGKINEGRRLQHQKRDQARQKKVAVERLEERSKKRKNEQKTQQGEKKRRGWGLGGTSTGPGEKKLKKQPGEKKKVNRGTGRGAGYSKTPQKRMSRNQTN